MRYAAVFLVALVLACGGGRPRPTPGPTVTPAPTATPLPSATPAPPTPTLEPAARYEQLARAAARPLDTRSTLGLPPGEWSVSAPLPGEALVTFPMTAGNDNAQTVRQGARQVAAIVKALFDGEEGLAAVNVIGTLPLNGQEAPAISILITRAEYAGWSGVAEELPNLQVSERLQ